MNTSTPPLRIMLADDHPMMRQGLRMMIDQESDMQVVAEAKDGAEAIAQFRLHRPDATLMDLSMPQIDGLAAIRILHDISPAARIVVLTTFPGDARVSHALSVGATSYLLKTAASAEIITALRDAVGGHITLGTDVMRDVRDGKRAETLSEGEITELHVGLKGTNSYQNGGDYTSRPRSLTRVGQGYTPPAQSAWDPQPHRFRRRQHCQQSV